MLPKNNVLVIVPCFNEEASIETLLQDIALAGYKSVVVIDDGSTDRTGILAGKRAPVVRLVRNLGIGGAVQTGIIFAKRHGFDYCVQIDGDGQHPPKEIDKLLQAQKSCRNSIVIGSRYLTQGTFRSTAARRLGSGIISAFLQILFKNCKVTDPTSGMRLLDRQAIDLFSAHYPYDFPEPVSLAVAAIHGLSMKEVAVEMKAREFGVSSIGGLKTAAYMIRVLGYIALAKLVTKG